MSLPVAHSRPYASFSRCWLVKLLFQFSSRFLTWVPFSNLSHPPCFCLTWDWFSQVSLIPVLIFITGMLTIFFQFRKFFQSSVFQAQTISPPHFTSQSPPSWSTELCTWTSRQAWLTWSGRVGAGRRSVLCEDPRFPSNRQSSREHSWFPSSISAPSFHYWTSSQVLLSTRQLTG